MNQVAKLEGKQMSEKPAVSPADKLRSQLGERKSEFMKVLPSHISYEQFQRVVMTACIQNPDLINADRSSLLFAAIKAATDGLLPDGREGAFVLFNKNFGTYKDPIWKNSVQWMPMYFGILKKVMQSGEFSNVFAALAYKAEEESGRFMVFLGTNPRIEHRPIYSSERGPMVAAYAVAIRKDGGFAQEVLTAAEVDKVRRSSKSGAASASDVKNKRAQAEGDPKGIWKEWPEEMAKKTAFRRLSKWLPQCKDIIERAFENDDTMEAFNEYEADQGTTERPLTVTQQDTQDEQSQLSDESGQPDLSQMIDDAEQKQGEKVEVVQEEEKPKPQSKKKSEDTKPEPEKESKPLPTKLETILVAISETKDDAELDAVWNVEFAKEIEGLSKDELAKANTAYSAQLKTFAK